MKIGLNYQQRLNLMGLIGSQKGTMSEMRALWPLADKIDLTEEEKKEINYRLVPNGEYLNPTWDVHEPVDKEIELSPEDLTKIKSLIESWPQFRAQDRMWLEPLWSKLA